MKNIVKIAIVCLIFTIFNCSAYAITEDNSSLENDHQEIIMREIFAQSNYIGKDINGNLLFETDLSNIQIAPYNTESTAGKTSFVIVPSDDEDRKNWEKAVTLRASDYASQGEQWDASRSCKIYSTVYYSLDGDYATLKYITGGYSKSDHTISVTSQQIDYCCAQGNGQNSTTNKGSSSSWTIYPPSYWQPLNVRVGFGVMGCTSYTTVQRSGTPWMITLVNNPINTN